MKPLTLHVISHTHWDREWYQTFEQFRFRLVEMLDALLDLLARDPDFRHFHLDGQTIVLDDYLAIRPERAAELHAQIASGRLLVGPWYVQPDEFLVSGESIIRNLQIGRRIARRYGEPMAVGYLPDTFGHIAQMPQIMRGFGLDSFVLGRGLNGEQTGGTEFWWQSPDGSRVLGLFLACWYHNAMRFPSEPAAALAFVEKIVADLRQAGAKQHLLLMNGVDHLVAQEDLSAILKSLRRRYRGGTIIHAALPDLVAALREQAGPELNTLYGELRDETKGPLLTGVLSARAYLKQANSAAERLLESWAEPYETVAALLGKPYQRGYLRYAWKTLLQNHAHDSICGCSLDQVHREMLPRFAQAQQVGEDLLRRALGFIAAQVDTRPAPAASEPLGSVLESCALLVHNPLPRPRSDVVIAEVDFAQRPEYCTVELLDDRGQPVPVQVLGRVQRTRKEWSPTETPHEVLVSRYTIAAYCADLPACGYRSYSARLVKGQPAQGGVGQQATGNRQQEISIQSDALQHTTVAFEGGRQSIQNEWLAASVAPNGTLRLVVRHDGTSVGDGQVFDGLHFFRDEGDVGDQYNFFKPLEDRAVETLGGGAELRVLRAGPLIAEIEVTLRPQVPRTARADRQGRSDDEVALAIRSRLRLVRGRPWIEIDTTVENSAEDHRLRAVFPLGAPIAEALADTTFGAVARPVDLPACWPYSSRDRPQRSFVSVQNGGRGLAVLSQGIYEHDTRPDGQVELTLLRCVGHMFVDVHTLEPLDAVTDGQCPGAHRFAYAIMPHAAYAAQRAAPHSDAGLAESAIGAADLAEAAQRFNTPLRAWQAEQHAGPLAASASFLSLEPAALQLSALKYAEDREGVVVRCYNASDATVQGSLRLWGAWRAAHLVNLDEERQQELHLEEDGSLVVRAAPWQVVTVELL